MQENSSLSQSQSNAVGVYWVGCVGDYLQLATLKSRLRYICILSFSALLPLPLEDKNLFHFSSVLRSKLAADVCEKLCAEFYIYLPHIAYVARVGEKDGGVASNWHRLHAARHHHKETRRRQKFFNFCYNFYHLQLPQPVPATATAPVPVWIPSLLPPLLGNPLLL